MRARLISKRVPVVLGVCWLAGMLASGCSSTNTPTGPSTSGLPKIDSMSPSSPLVSDSPQTLTFSGSFFRTGLILDVVTPVGGAQTFAADAIQNLQQTSFSVQVILSVPGQYQFTAKNVDSQPSAPFTATVQSQTANPQIASISPSLPARNSQPQTLFVTGSQFADGLVVTITGPTGGLTVLTGGDIAGLTPTSFQISVTLASAGTYTIMVTNPTGESSGPLSFSVTPS